MCNFFPLFLWLLYLGRSLFAAAWDLAALLTLLCFPLCYRGLKVEAGFFVIVLFIIVIVFFTERKAMWLLYGMIRSEVREKMDVEG